MKKAAKRGRGRPSETGASQLAAALGVSRQNLHGHIKRLGKKAPGLNDIAAWEMLLSATGREGTTPVDQRAELAKHRTRLVKAGASREELRLARERGSVLDKNPVLRAIDRACAAYYQARERWEQIEGPESLAGLSDKDEIRKRLSEAHQKSDQAMRAVLGDELGDKDETSK